jgi:hypothetical protein
MAYGDPIARKSVKRRDTTPEGTEVVLVSATCFCCGADIPYDEEAFDSAVAGHGPKVFEGATCSSIVSCQCCKRSITLIDSVEHMLVYNYEELSS